MTSTRKGRRRAALSRTICLTAISIAAGVGFAAGAGANDMYLRGGIGVDWTGTVVFTDVDCNSSPRDPLYGCGTGRDGAPTRSTGRFVSMTAVEFGLGYRVKSVRLEVLLEYRPGFTFEGCANFLPTDNRHTVTAELSTVSGMFCVYLDLPRLGVPASGPMEPSIGAVLGVVRTQDRKGMDDDRRGRIAIDRTRKPRSGLAPHGPWRGSFRRRRRKGGMA